MTVPRLQRPSFSDRDMDFIVDTADPEAKNKVRLLEIILEDKDFRALPPLQETQII